MIVLTNKKEIEKYMRIYYHFIGDGHLLDALENYLEKYGFGIEGVGRCSFASEYEDWEEDYFGDTGVEMYFDQPAVGEDTTFILSYEEFYTYLSDVCDKYTEKHPERAETVKDYLRKIRANFNIKY